MLLYNYGFGCFQRAFMIRFTTKMRTIGRTIKIRHMTTVIMRRIFDNYLQLSLK